MGALRVLPGGVGEASSPFARAREHVAGSERFLASAEASEMKHSDMERDIEARGRELMRLWYQAWLDLQVPGDVEQPVVDAEGKERTRKRTQSRELESIFGTVTMERTGYGAEGEASLHPLDGKLNLPEERYSLEVRRRAAEEASKNCFEEAAETLARYTGAHVPKRQIEELVSRAAQDFDDFYETRRQEGAGAPAGAGSLLVITSDGKGVVMHKDDLRPATRKAAERKGASQLRTRLSKGEKRGRKRMATVAAIYTVPPYVRTPQEMLAVLSRAQEPEPERTPRPRPEHKRVLASLEKEPREVLEEAFLDACDRDPDGVKTWVALVDGNEAQLAILEDLAEQYAARLTIVLDIFHVLEYVWEAGHAFHAEGSAEVEPWVLERLGRILQGEASQVAAGMRRSATKRGLPKNQRKPIDTCAGYLLKYKSYLAYDEYLALGMPIATGVIEGACRHLVKDRLARTGARWRLAGAEAVLRLRALRSSGDFDQYWRFHEACEHERNHPHRYAEGKVPATRSTHNPTPSPHPHLKRIK